jgi:hypothetical protein
MSAEDTFERDLPLSETEAMIRRLAEKIWSASRKESRIARTVVLKLKTSDFNILTRSHTPSSPPSSCEELTTIALALRERVELGPDRRFRLVGVGLSNFCEPEEASAQAALFDIQCRELQAAQGEVSRSPPRHLTPRAIWAPQISAVRTYANVERNRCLQMAAALSYYFVMALFPSLIFLYPNDR